jgi:rod shape-determining protein MreC
VVVPDGVVGAVHRVGGAWADVRLATDFSSRLGAILQRTRTRCTAAGTGQGLVLQNVLRSEDVKESDVVVTSGTDGIFPKGLVVGKVTRVKAQSASMFLEAQVLPAVNLRQLEEVFVLPGLPGSDVAAAQWRQP